MSFNYEIYKSQRIVPIRFRRAITGAPVLGKPDIDDRGYYRTTVTVGNDHGPVVGITEGNESEIKLERVRIDNGAALYVTSSDAATMTVTDSKGKEELPPDKEVILKIKGVKGAVGANPQTAKVEIRYGSKTGPIVGEISVWVFKKLSVLLTPHNVKISSATAASIASRADINAVIDAVKAFWEPCGISFDIYPIQNTSVILATAGRVTRSEVKTLFTANYICDSINAYFVYQYRDDSDWNLGYGTSRANAITNSLVNPGIILGDATVGDATRNIDRHTDIHWLANDLAHEIGHFFALEHVDRKNDRAPRNDTWSVRMLMYPVNKTGSLPKAWQNNVGYGTNYRGGLITHKNLTDSASAANHLTDGESLIARGIISSPGGPY